MHFFTAQSVRKAKATLWSPRLKQTKKGFQCSPQPQQLSASQAFDGWQSTHLKLKIPLFCDGKWFQREDDGSPVQW